ncbi:hypothetical protein GCM10018980_18320 [Streptomyces capoamus]|uniref:Uncharacterized protein n=1 Tax=Streptomyces capoamus TaxID=68183 RepID=A0A919EU71_9ACTN|nr:hypothetical protein [Streptomyces capoamus]GGW16297.1 hypothetical protein GCM10010501_31940 [Streptomyces libani subsp. rufus]GHG42507.1 hypothetical protein GCM10018980_18320 [Streptomyces capoamus]
MPKSAYGLVGTRIYLAGSDDEVPPVLVTPAVPHVLQAGERAAVLCSAMLRVVTRAMSGSASALGDLSAQAPLDVGARLVRVGVRRNAAGRRNGPG